MVRKLFIYGLIILTFPFTLLALSMTEPASDNNIINFANTHLLPENFLVYTNGHGVINHPVPGFSKKILMVVNDYKDTPGCYITCYSHDKSKSIYSVSNDIFVYGQIRVSGGYDGRKCVPTGHANKDISADVFFKNLCSSKLNDCQKARCWAGGDTGGWFGIQ